MIAYRCGCLVIIEGLESWATVDAAMPWLRIAAAAWSSALRKAMHGLDNVANPSEPG